MTFLAPADPSAADWILRAEVHWWRLVTLGPPGFSAYARLRYIPDPDYPGQSENSVSRPPDRPEDTEQLSTAAGVLAAHTRTPGQAYALFWDGWGSTEWTAHLAPHLSAAPLPGGEREYFLAAVSLEELCRELAAPGSWQMPPPSFLWPADRAWCITSDVDPHWAGIAATHAGIRALAEHPVLDVVETSFNADQPFYH
ncbi:hypothetical protein [Nesterenkonia sp.]|uniref:hypothetical protein n=1 Tax=Nesterenkonia sp. TaxID=704201 RepID=UPI002635A5B0|nr:hypothetical protein [Nesterenkonia sp.]